MTQEVYNRILDIEWKVKFLSDDERENWQRIVSLEKKIDTLLEHLGLEYWEDVEIEEDECTGENQRVYHPYMKKKENKG